METASAEDPRVCWRRLLWESGAATGRALQEYGCGAASPKVDAGPRASASSLEPCPKPQGWGLPGQATDCASALAPGDVRATPLPETLSSEDSPLLHRPLHLITEEGPRGLAACV